MSSLSYQDDAVDPTQLAFAERKQRQREARADELWRWVMTQKMGREFLFTQLLERLGPYREIRSEEDVALHNVAFTWLTMFVMRHRELYLQMLAEQAKRQEDERREVETARAQWAQREETEA